MISLVKHKKHRNSKTMELRCHSIISYREEVL